MNQPRRDRGRPLGPPGACLRLRGFEGTASLGRTFREAPEAIWMAVALTEVGLRLVSPRGGPGTLLPPRFLAALGTGLDEIHATGTLPMDPHMTIGCAGIRLDARWIDGSPQAVLSWPRSPGILVIGDELLRLAAVAELARDFSTEFRAYPRLEYWADEASAIPCVEVLEACTGIPLPRHKPRDRKNRVAA